MKDFNAVAIHMDNCQYIRESDQEDPVYLFISAIGNLRLNRKSSTEKC